MFIWTDGFLLLLLLYKVWNKNIIIINEKIKERDGIYKILFVI